ncbi:chemotaxis protein CheB [Aliikangiella sp. IMCC44653]
MSSLKIGLVASSSDESQLLVNLLTQSGAQIVHQIEASEINDEHLEDQSIHVWLLCVDDDSWHDQIDHLLDESEIPVYFNEPGTLQKQSHPEFWCSNLLNRLYEMTDIEPDDNSSSVSEAKVTSDEETTSDDEITSQNEVELSENNRASEASEPTSSIADNLNLETSLEELDLNSVGLPDDIAAELVSELESLPSVLAAEEEQFATDENSIETSPLAEPETVAEEVEIDFEHLPNEPVEENFNIGLGDAPTESVLSKRDTETQELDTPPVDYFEEETVELDLSHDEESLIQDIQDEVQAHEGNAKAAADEDSLELSIEQPMDLDSTPFELAELDLGGDDDDISLDISNFSSDDNTTEHDVEIENKAEGEPLAEPSEFELDLELADFDSEIAEESSEGDVSSGDGDQSEIERLSANLSLESLDGEKPVSGKAQFAIDLGDDELLAKSDTKDLEETNTETSQAAISQQAAATGETLEDFAEIEAEVEIESAVEPELDLDLGAPDELSLDDFEIDDDSEIALDPEVVQSIAASALESDENAEKNDEEKLAKQDQSENLIEPSSEEFESALESFSLTEESKSATENSTPVSDVSETEVQNEIDKISEEVTEIVEPSSDTIQLADFEIPMLEEAAVHIEFEEKQNTAVAKPTTPCWVIGASLGGPAAVKRFLHCIPKDINASFIIAQHIDENFLPVLAEILTNNSQFEVEIANGSNNMQAGKVYLAPLKGKIVILRDGSMLIDHSQKWSGPYSPCINDVIEAVSGVYAESSGAIIFSGMGEDGLQGAIKMRQAGGKVWAQSPETCANASMPESVIDAQQTDFIGSPEELAQRLLSFLPLSVTS